MLEGWIKISGLFHKTVQKFKTIINKAFFLFVTLNLLNCDTFRTVKLTKQFKLQCITGGGNGLQCLSGLQNVRSFAQFAVKHAIALLLNY